MPGKPRRPVLGPRGGEKSVTPGGFVRTTLYFVSEEAEFLRSRAFQEKRTISDLVREAVHRQYPELDKL